ncbi:hypothetical protein ADIARSV_3874 [Arcticibacter svalbardensis MN12-7]|uniref:Uncharacterized protein n=1 Tax=Arcticibacter svalbardensis MN12-7 TaxID=1150600 RepID=R9GMP0_9SPHI|nr:hypothetical protein ADIARSV_3874 [Arcticibacter svalbardensis MN12-7]
MDEDGELKLAPGMILLFQVARVENKAQWSWVRAEILLPAI